MPSGGEARQLQAEPAVAGLPLARVIVVANGRPLVIALGVVQRREECSGAPMVLDSLCVHADIGQRCVLAPSKKRITETEFRVGPLLAMGARSRFCDGRDKANEMTQEET